MISAALATRLFTFSNKPIFPKSIAFERLYTKLKYSSDTISTHSLTQYHPTISIFTRISFRWTSMCFPFLMMKVALAILWWSAIKTMIVWLIYSIGDNTMRQSPAFLVYSQILQNTITKSIFACGASVTFHRRKSSLDTRSSVPETTSCRCFM